MESGYIYLDNPTTTSPSMNYNVKVTQGDMDEINHLVKRNYTGLNIAWTPAMIAVRYVKPRSRMTLINQLLRSLATI